MSSSQPQLEDVPELMQQIQLRLPVKIAARTSVLSKSWLHAWTTIPNLRFCIGTRKDMKKLVDMERTLIRYHHDNIPIEKFDLDIDIDDQDSASLVEKHIRTIATNTLKELSLSFLFQFYGASFNFPDEILSCENLTKIRVSSAVFPPFTCLWMSNHSHHPITIKCVSLRELHLDSVHISQEVLDGILSSCRLLVKVQLIICTEGLNTIKLKNLHCLDNLRIFTDDRGSTTVEIDNVPNLRLFNFCLRVRGENPRVPFNAHSISLGSRLMELAITDVVTDNASLDMIKSGAHFLESLTLYMTSWKSERFHFTCATIKRLSLLLCPRMLIDVNVYAPNLLFFRYEGGIMPNLLFPISTLIKKTRFRVSIRLPIDASFFLKMREALALSSNCYVHISLSHGTLNPAPPPWDIDIDDLRTRLPFPRAMKVQQLSFETWWDDECKWVHSPFFDAFFEICHPNHVTAMQNFGSATTSGNYFCKLLLREVLEDKNKNKNKKKTTMLLWPRCLKYVQIRCHQKWETLTSSHQSFLKGPSPAKVYFKLKWR